MKTATTYVQEFDSLRALAALGVMAAHFEPSRGIWLVARLENRLGAVGVDLFFALSGFLITGILLDCRPLEASQPRFVTLRQFYARRFLRILPLYYLAYLLFATALEPSLRQNWIWFATYTVNFGNAYSQNWPLMHFWTLAVEEQFYFLWPFAVLFLPLRVIVPVCALGAVASLVFRVALWFAGASDVAITQFTPCCLEPLVLGAAFATRKEQAVSRSIWILLAVSVFAALLVFVFAPRELLFVVARSLYGISFSTLIYVVASHSGSERLTALRWAPLMFLGRISYGLYVWHLPVLWWLGPNPVGENRVGNFAVLVAATVIVSAISWYALEGPINAFKNRFPYRVRKQQDPQHPGV